MLRAGVKLGKCSSKVGARARVVVASCQVAESSKNDIKVSGKQ